MPSIVTSTPPRLGARSAMSLVKQHSPAERALLAAGTWSYACGAYEALNKVPEVLPKVVETLRDLGFATVVESPGYRVDPEMKSLRADARSAAKAAPVVVVYYTGHGAHPDRDTYYLVGQRSQPA